jgi:hypothetical protein
VRRPLSLATLALTLLLIALPAQAEQRLETTPACDGVLVTGAGFPEPVALLMVRDVRSGRVLAGPVKATTGADGSFRARLRADLEGAGGLEVTAWKQVGTTVVMTARDLVDQPVDQPCVAATARTRAAGATLPLTGGPRPALASFGLSLVALGLLVRHAARVRGRHERR